MVYYNLNEFGFKENFGKNLFVYWDNNNEISFLRYLTIKTFKFYNPDWKIWFISSQNSNKRQNWITKEHKNINNNKNKNNNNNFNYYLDFLMIIDYHFLLKMSDFGFNDDLNEIYRSDILRNFFLFKFGGIWSDLDIFYIKPIPKDLININFVCYNENVEKKYYSIGFLGGKKNNNIYNNLFNRQLLMFKNRDYYNDYQMFGNKIYKSEHLFCKNIPMSLVYFLDHTQIKIIYDGYLGLEEKKNIIKEIQEKSIGIHWYAGNQISTIYNFLLYENNYQNYNNILCNFIKNFFAIYNKIEGKNGQ
jgi:hypothetical protein